MELEKLIPKRILTEFKSSIDGMVGTSRDSFKDSRSFQRVSQHQVYTKQEAIDIITNGDPNQLRNLSVSFFYASGLYRRFCIYLATMLFYTPLLVPHSLAKSTTKGATKKIKDSYLESLTFVDNLNFEKMCQQFAITVIVEGAYYGYVKEGKNTIANQALPFEYCRNRFQTVEGLPIVELDVRYFNTITDKVLRDQVLKTYPKGLAKCFMDYTTGKSASYWYSFEAGVGVYFNLFEERPILSDIIPAIIDYAEYREMEKSKDQQELKTLVIQKMPIDGMELVFDPEEVQVIHNGVVKMLSSNPNIDVLTTFGEVAVESLQDKRQTISNNLEKIEKSIYSEAGISKGIFAADGNLAIDKSVKNDLAMMMGLADSFAMWLTNVVNLYANTKSVIYKARILPISYYNQEDFSKVALEMAGYGYSFLVPALALRMSQLDLLSIKELEGNILDMSSILIPLQSAHTQSKDAGAPAKDDSKKTDKTIANTNKGGV